MMKNFLNVSDLSRIEVEGLIELALRMKNNKEAYSNSLKDKKVGLYFQKPSMRTRVSFEVGVIELGGHPINLLAEEIKIGSREPIKDVARVLSRYLDAIMLRVNRHSDLEEIALYSKIPIINGLSDLSHPCQALADIVTIREKKGSSNIKMVYFGDGNNVCNSLIEICALLEIEFVVCCPVGYEPSISSRKHYYSIERDPLIAAKQSDVLYTDVWTSMGQEQESFQRKKIFAQYKVTSLIMSAAKDDAIFMHCLPAHRGEEVDDDVVESENSVVFDQAENRLHAQKALMSALITKELKSS